MVFSTDPDLQDDPDVYPLIEPPSRGCPAGGAGGAGAGGGCLPAVPGRLRGLCPRCGADLNRGACAVAPPPPNSRTPWLFPSEECPSARSGCAAGSHRRRHADPGLPALRLRPSCRTGCATPAATTRRRSGRGRGRLSVIRVAVDAMGGDQAPRRPKSPGWRSRCASCPWHSMVQLVGQRPRSSGARAPCRPSTEPPRDPRGP